MELENIKRDFLSGKFSKADYIQKMHVVHQNLFEYTHFIKDTDIASILITDNNVIMCTRDRGIRLYVDPLDERIVPIEILNFRNYEKEELEIIAKLLTDVSTAMDIGANIGWYSLNLAIIKPELCIHAFEPIPKTYYQLQRNIVLNNIQTIITHNIGFSDRDDTIPFYYTSYGSGSASAANISERDNVEQIQCKVMTIDYFVQHTGIALDFMKCDVEGAEFLVFQGGYETIKKYKPIIFSEMLRKWAVKFNYHPNQIISFLKDLGYRCFIPHNGQLKEFFEMDENTVETNFFFLHPDKHSLQISTLLR